MSSRYAAKTEVPVDRSDLHLGPGFTLPVDAVTQTFGILGQKGSGKSNAAVVMAEEMWTAGLPWVAVDPKGDWWGIRSSADGTEPGLALPVFGGLHGDVPLDPGSGAYVADLVVDENLTAVVDVSDFSKADRARFLAAFFDRLYRRHRGDPAVRHVFMEEAHEYCPQVVGREEGRLKEAVARIVLQGRTFGLGASVCSQRSARIHKDVLTQVGTLVALRTLAELDRKAIEGWITEHNVARELLATLPALGDGEAWLWSPSFLGRTERVQFRRRSTFDSGATPTVGRAARPPATLADVDLAAIKAAMADTIERAQAEDPRRLKRRIAELERQLREQRPAVPERVEVRVEVPVIDEATVARLEDAISQTRQALAEIAGALGRASAGLPPSTVWPRPQPSPTEPVATAPVGPRAAATVGGPSGWAALGKSERAVLTVLAQHPTGRTRTQLALLTGYSVKSSSLSNALGALRSAGLVAKGGDPVQATNAGLELAAGNVEPLPTGAALYESWAGRLGRAERAVLDVLAEAWPESLDRDTVADRTGYSATSSSLSNALGRLRSLDLVVGWRTSDDLMEAVGRG